MLASMWSGPCTSVPPTCTWFDVEPAASAAGAVVAWCEIALEPGERSMRHCSEHAVASGCCQMESRGAQCCSSQALTVSDSDYRQVSVQVESSADGECGRRLGCGNCTIVQLLKCASRKTGTDLGWLQAPSFHWLAADRRWWQWRTTGLMSQHVAGVPFRSSESDDQCFWFVRVELQAILHVSLSDVGSTCGKNGQSGGCVVGAHCETKLCVISILVVLNTVTCNDVSNWTGVNG